MQPKNPQKMDEADYFWMAMFMALVAVGCLLDGLLLNSSLGYCLFFTFATVGALAAAHWYWTRYRAMYRDRA